MLSSTVQGCALLEQKHSPCSCAYARQASRHHREYCKKFDHKTFVRMLPSQDLKIMKFTCMASSNSHRKNPDFSRQNKGFSRGRNRQNQDREKAERSEDSEILSSKNGSMLSISTNSRHQATATPGQREKEIVELFRKVQAQLRERAAVKEEKKIESFQQGQGEKGTVDSLLKLLRKHSVDQRKRSGSGEDYIPDRPERSISFDEEKTSSFTEVDNIATDEGVQEPQPVPYTRPASKFQRRSPVPRVKFQPVYSEQEDVGSVDSPTAAGDKELGSVDTDLEPVFFDEREEPFEDDLSDSSDVEEPEEEIEEPSIVENRDLGSMKLLELKELAKSRGVKGYSKLKKVELVKLLEGM